ncbi:MAG: hypothetical protein IJA25_08145 [Anaerotignum sp.]|nr:hypothetical protein [Anaerotignum sp.]MBQ7102935.1 hypothetical protein [Anaerotignum sp.]
MVKIGEAFRATDRLELVSTWKVIGIDQEKYHLVAIGETLTRCEADYHLLKRIRPESTQWADCCTIKVNEEWFQLRKIEILKEEEI